MEVVKDNSVGTNKEPEKQVETPKDVKIDKKEIEMLMSLDMNRNKLILALGGLEEDYINQKSRIITSLQQNKKELSTVLDTLKKKYKIIGNIVGFDGKDGKLIVK